MLIVAPQPVARAGLRVLLHARAEIEVVDDRAPDEVATTVSALRPDVLVVAMDRDDWPAGGLGAITGDTSEASPKLVVVGSGDDLEHVAEIVAAGADAYLPSDVSAEQLRHAVREVHAGRHVIPPELAFGAILATRARPDDPVPLTPRELEVLGLLSKGQTNAQIAGGLFLAVGTVKVHVEHILAKLGAVSRTDAAVRAAERGLLSGGDSSIDRHRP